MTRTYWFYAHVAMKPQHEPSRRWLDERLNGTAAVGLPWQSLLGFVRLVTNPRVFERPLSMTDAWKQVESWLGCAVVRIPVPTERHAEVLGPLLAQVSRPNLVPAAHLAAIEHGLILCSTDGDFARFTGLRWENPLQ